MKFTTIAAVLLSAVAQLALTGATPIANKRDVYVPPVLYPHAGTVWYSGQTHNVTWYVLLILQCRCIGLQCCRDNSDPPQNISNRALILLRWDNTATPSKYTMIHPRVLSN